MHFAQIQSLPPASRGKARDMESCVRARNRSEERRVGKECRSLCDWSSDVCSSDLPCAQAHASTHVLDASLFFEQRDHRFFCVLVKLSAVGLFDAACISRKFNRCHLHPEAKPEIWNLVFARETDRKSVV